MPKGMILYSSKYGATKKYAEWLAEETGFSCTELGRFDKAKLREFDTVILGGGIYASGIAGISFLRKNRDALKGKRTAVFCVGASPYEEKAFRELKAHNLKEDLKKIPCFYCRGAWDEGKMTFKDRTLCKLLQKAVSHKGPGELEPWMAALLGAAGETQDWTDKNALAPLISFCLQ